MGTDVSFDARAMISALETKRATLGFDWSRLADELWGQSSDLNAELADHRMCPGALVRTVKRGTMSCQYALIILRWLAQPPEDFLTGAVVAVGDTTLPEPGPGARLRWDLAQLHSELDRHRRECGLTWAALAGGFGCTPNRLTNLRTARLADMELTMRITQQVAQPAARFVHAAGW